MGWTSVSNKRGVSSLKMLERYSSLYVGSHWTSEEGLYRLEVTDLVQGPGGAYGILSKTHTLTGDVVRFAIVVLIQRSRGEFAWKELTEFEGPREVGMPLGMLNRLSEPRLLAAGNRNVDHLIAWRDAVRAYHAKRAARVTVTVGNILEFKDPLNFMLDGQRVPVQRFKVTEWGKRKRLQALPGIRDNFACRLSRDAWLREYEVIQ